MLLQHSDCKCGKLQRKKRKRVVPKLLCHVCTRVRAGVGVGERLSHQVGKMRTERRQTGAGKLWEEEVNGRMSTA